MNQVIRISAVLFCASILFGFPKKNYSISHYESAQGSVRSFQIIPEDILINVVSCLLISLLYLFISTQLKKQQKLKRTKSG